MSYKVLRETDEAVVYDVGERNPILEIKRDALLAALRRIANDAGFENHELCTVQFTIPAEAIEKKVEHWWDVPEIVLMLSNLPRDRRE